MTIHAVKQAFIEYLVGNIPECLWWVPIEGKDMYDIHMDVWDCWISPYFDRGFTMTAVSLLVCLEVIDKVYLTCCYETTFNYHLGKGICWTNVPDYVLQEVTNGGPVYRMIFLM